MNSTGQRGDRLRPIAEDDGRRAGERWANGEPTGKSLAPEMKYRGLALHLFGREPVICTVSGLRPGTRSMTQMTHDLDKHLTTGWHERERRQAEQRRQTGQRC